MSEEADSLLASLAKGPPANVEEVIVKCAEPYVDGEAESAYRAFALVRPLVRAESYEGWARARLEILDELNLLGAAIGRDPLFPPLSRALLAEDTSELDDVVDARFRGKPVPLPSSMVFERTPRAARAFEEALEVPRAKARIRGRTLSGIVIAGFVLLFFARRLLRILFGL
jgi:hypothetical protein